MHSTDLIMWVNSYRYNSIIKAVDPSGYPPPPAAKCPSLGSPQTISGSQPSLRNDRRPTRAPIGWHSKVTQL
ncbi:hypothetical protein NPIL_680471 [Nephila pilipes]|uniref:Uncharacterized protein n=1 Tax=Nephila pilipes TaxID=299642 RepID=A0A8X6NMM9_NEPPI|nr:hypothetical protein NPIL_680471 [Nephila pilipes]